MSYPYPLLVTAAEVRQEAGDRFEQDVTDTQLEYGIKEAQSRLYADTNVEPDDWLQSKYAARIDLVKGIIIKWAAATAIDHFGSKEDNDLSKSKKEFAKEDTGRLLKFMSDSILDENIVTVTGEPASYAARVASGLSATPYISTTPGKTIYMTEKIGEFSV